MFELKKSVIAICLVFGSSTVAGALPRYDQGGTDYAEVAPLLSVRSDVYLADPNPEDAYFIAGVRNRTANPVRIIWYGNPSDGDSLVPQIGARNHGSIIANLNAVGSASGEWIDEEKDYRSSIAIDGVSNALDAYGWSAQSNSNDVSFTLEQIQNKGNVQASAVLEAGEGSHRSLIVTNASANGISLFGSVDYGKYVYLEGVAGEVAVDALVGGSGSVASVASLPVVRLASVDSTDSMSSAEEVEPIGSESIPLSDVGTDTDFHGKNVVIALDRLDNEGGRITGSIHAKGNAKSQPADTTTAQDYASVTWASGNAVSLRTTVMTQDKRTYAYDKQNTARLGQVNNTGVLTGQARLEAGAVITHTGTNYTRAIDSGNGVSVAARTVRFAKHRTSASIGDIRNDGLIAGTLNQVSSDNRFTGTGLTFEGIHYYSQAQAFGSGNGVNLFVEATQQSLGEVDADTGVAADNASGMSLGRLDNRGVIRGEANLRAGDGHGVLSVETAGVGNGVSAYLKAGAAQTYHAKIGDIHNTGMITGSLISQAGSNDTSVPRQVAQLQLTTQANWNKLKRDSQAPDRPKDATTCKSQACHQTNALTEVRGSGNGISIFTNRINGGELSLGDVFNQGVISGYASMTHGYGDNQYQRVDYLGAGVGIALDQAMNSNLTNTGIISGNHAALLAKSEISDAYSTTEPQFLSGYASDKLKNYGLMAGMMIAGNYDGKRTNTETDKSTYLYFNADQDPIQNLGTYVYFASRGISAQNSTRYSSVQVEAVRHDFQQPSRSETLKSYASDIRGILDAKSSNTLFGTYLTFADKDIQKIEKAYGGETASLSADNRVKVFLNIYEMMTDKQTADTFKIHHNDPWIRNEAWRVQEDYREILAKKNQLQAKKAELDSLLSGTSLGTGLEKLVGMYTEYYNSQLSALNQKLNTINEILTTDFGQPAKPKIEDDHLSSPALVDQSYGTIDRIEVASQNPDSVQIGEQSYRIVNAAVSASGRDSYYTPDADLIERTIVNGVGIEKGALIANRDLTLRQSIVNGLATGLYLEGAHQLTLDQTVVNANGFDLKVATEGNSVKTVQPFAIRGDENNNVLTLRQQSVLNGNIDLGAGDDRLVIADSSVALNARWVEMGEGKDTLVLGENTHSSDPIVIRTPFKQLERLEVNQNAKIYASSQIPSLDELVLNAKLTYEGDYVIQAGQTLRIGVKDPLHYGSLEVENGSISIAEGTLFVDAASFQGDTVALGKMLSNVISLKSNAVQDVDDDTVSQPQYYILGHFAKVEDNSELFDFVLVYSESAVSSNVVTVAEVRRRSRRAAADLPKSSSMTLLARLASAEAQSLEERVSDPTEKSAASILGAVLADQPSSELSLAMMSLSSADAVRTTVSQSVPHLRTHLGGAVQQLGLAMSEPIPFDQVGAWAQVLGQTAKQKADRIWQAYDAHHYGFALGRAVRPSDEWVVGFNGAYVHARIQNEDKRDKFDMDMWQIGAYTHWKGDSAWSVDAQLAYAWGRFYGKRQFDWLAKQVARSSALTDMAQVGMKFAYELEASSDWHIKPFVQTRYAVASLEAYQEEGSALGLNVASEIYRTWQTDLGVASTWKLNERLGLSASLAVGVEALTQPNALSVAYQARPDSTFVLETKPNSRLHTKLGLAMNYALSNKTVLGVQYQMQAKKRYLDQQARLNMRIAF